MSFEQFLIQEVRAFIYYNQRNESLTYWRSKDYEVDLVVGRSLALEFKMSKVIKNHFFRGLKALKEEGLVKNYLLIGRFRSEGTTEDGIRYMPYQVFLERLWRGEIL